MGLQECLLCSETLEKEKEGKNNCSLKGQIRSVFILRKILEISQSTCSNLLLRTQNNPSTWFSTCWECFATVIEAERIFSELTKLEIKWKRLKTSLESKVLNCTQQKTSRRRPKRQKCEIVQTIRQEAAKRLERVSEGAEDPCTKVHISSTINIPPDEIITADFEAVKSDPLKIEEDEDIKEEDFEFNDEFPSPDCNFQKNSPISTVNDENIEIFERSKAVKEEDSKTMEESSDEGHEGHVEAGSDFLPSENSDSEAEISAKNKKTPSRSRTRGKNLKTSSRSRTRRNCVKKVQVGDYRCEYCPTLCTTVLKKKMHEIRRHNIKHDFKCPLCPKNLASESNLFRHLKSFHPKKSSSDLPGYCKVDVPDVELNGDVDDGNCETQQTADIGIKNEETDSATKPLCKTKKTANYVPTPIKCDHCDRLFVSTEKMKDHANRHHGATHQFSCKFCDKSYPALKKLVYHTKDIHNLRQERVKNLTKDSIVSCGECNKKVTYGYLQKHIKVVHRKENKPKRKRCNNKCACCNRRFSSIEEMKEHVNREHHDVVGDDQNCETQQIADIGMENEETQSSAQLMSETKTVIVVPPTIKCDYCERLFFSTEKMKNHTNRNHGGAHRFPCKYCGKKFIFLERLDYHFKYVHKLVVEKPKRYKSDSIVSCGECNKKFRYKYLKTHIALVHRKERNFVCEKCPEAFSSTTYLRFHQLKAHGEEEEQDVALNCQECDKKFSTPNTLKSHVETIHRGLFKFKCPICGIGRGSQSHLDEHIMSAHTDNRPFACSFCPKAYTTKTMLKDHMRTHTGERPYACSVCEKKFACRNHLRRHEKGVHASENLFECDKCQKKYPSRANLTAHKYHAHNNRQSSLPPKKLLATDELEKVLSSTAGTTRKIKRINRNPLVNSFRLKLQEHCRQTNEAGNTQLTTNSDTQMEKIPNNFRINPDEAIQ